MNDQPQQQRPFRLDDLVSRARAYIASLTPRQRWIGAGVIAAVVLVLVFTSGAGGRHVTINGYTLSNQQIAYLDATVGGHIPKGDYWLDPQSMALGVVGNPQPLGNIGYAQGGPMQAGQQQWYDVGQNYRGPFGDYMSDGQCSYVNEVPVGNC